MGFQPEPNKVRARRVMRLRRLLHVAARNWHADRDAARLCPALIAHVALRTGKTTVPSYSAAFEFEDGCVCVCVCVYGLWILCAPKKPTTK